MRRSLRVQFGDGYQAPSNDQPTSYQSPSGSYSRPSGYQAPLASYTRPSGYQEPTGPIERGVNRVKYEWESNPAAIFSVLLFIILMVTFLYLLVGRRT